MSNNKLEIKENEQLSKHTTFKVGGPAKYFCVAKSVEEIQEALAFAVQKKVDYFILAGGSNVIVSDEGYNGLVIKPELNDINFRDNIVRVGSGFSIDELVDIANAKGLKGLEWAGGLPGTVGGAVRGNAGAFGGEIKDVVSSVRCFELLTINYQLLTINNTECEFGYRTSIFKHNKEIILDIELQMQKGDPKELSAISKEHRLYRMQRHPIEFPCAGSIYKNVKIENVSIENREKFKDTVKTDPFPVIPTAAIIDRAGLKGYKIGDAQVSEKHPNYIINLGNAKASDIIALIEYEVKVVKEKYGIDLEVEPQLLGFNNKFNWESD